MKWAYFLLTFLIINVYQVVRVEGDADLEGLREVVTQMNADLRDMTKAFEEELHFLFDMGPNHIESRMNQAMMDLRQEKCGPQAVEYLQLAKQSTVGSFFTCAKLKTAAADSGKIILRTMKMTGNFAKTISDALQLTSECTNDSVFMSIRCWEKKVSMVMDDIVDNGNQILNYKRDVGVLASKVKENIDFCMGHHDKAVDDHIQQASYRAKNC